MYIRFVFSLMIKFNGIYNSKIILFIGCWFVVYENYFFIGYFWWNLEIYIVGVLGWGCENN